MSKKGDCSFLVAEDQKSGKRFPRHIWESWCQCAGGQVTWFASLSGSLLPFAIASPPTHPPTHLVHYFCFCETLVGLWVFTFSSQYLNIVFTACNPRSIFSYWLLSFLVRFAWLHIARLCMAPSCVWEVDFWPDVLSWNLWLSYQNFSLSEQLLKVFSLSE